MGFLDNSGDIILDAVLTDVGRNRLARGDGSFRIVKFALADDEINYELYRNSNHVNGAHASGSAYYDLNILQTPVLEAFTNNTSLMKSKLLSIPRTNLLYMPVIKLNEVAQGDFARNTSANQANGFFVVGVDEDTSRGQGASTNPGLQENNIGFMNGINGRGATIRLDQGLDTADLSPRDDLSSDLVETRYTIQMDNRLGLIAPAAVGRGGLSPAAKAFIDDDNIAYYPISSDTDPGFFGALTSDLVGAGSGETLSGPRGTSLRFKILSTVQLQDSNRLFTKLGSTPASANWTSTNGNTATVYYIDTTVRIVGETTGYRVDIPVRFAKKISC